MKPIRKPACFPGSIKTTCAALLLGGILPLALPFLAPPASAQSQTLVVNGTAHPAETGRTYESVSGTAGLYVFNPGASYSGTNITVSSTFSTGNGSNAVWVNNGGALALYGATITHADTDTGGNGIRLTATSTAILENINYSGGGIYGGISRQHILHPHLHRRHHLHRRG